MIFTVDYINLEVNQLQKLRLILAISKLSRSCYLILIITQSQLIYLFKMVRSLGQKDLHTFLEVSAALAFIQNCPTCSTLLDTLLNPTFVEQQVLKTFENHYNFII